MNLDMAHFLEPATGSQVRFDGTYPADFLVSPRPDRMPAWHLVGGLDPLDESELTGDEPDDGYPVLLSEWIARDGLQCLKVKLRGTDADWDYARLVKVGEIAIAGGVDWLTSDFNCTVTDPGYVNTILDRLVVEHPRISGMILYVEQPFPYDLEHNRIDVHSVSPTLCSHKFLTCCWRRTRARSWVWRPTLCSFIRMHRYLKKQCIQVYTGGGAVR